MITEDELDRASAVLGMRTFLETQAEGSGGWLLSEEREEIALRLLAQHRAAARRVAQWAREQNEERQFFVDSVYLLTAERNKLLADLEQTRKKMDRATRDNEMFSDVVNVLGTELATARGERDALRAAIEQHNKQTADYCAHYGTQELCDKTIYPDAYCPMCPKTWVINMPQFVAAEEGGELCCTSQTQ